MFIVLSAPTYLPNKDARVIYTQYKNDSREKEEIHSHGVLASPLTSRGLILILISLVFVGDVGDEWVIWVGVAEERADGQ